MPQSSPNTPKVTEPAVYRASKARAYWGARVRRKAMAIELAANNIRVNSLGRIFLETPMTWPFFENKAFRDEVVTVSQRKPWEARIVWM
jgi:hypothetical protein